MAIRIQTRGDTAAGWTTANPVLAEREVGIEVDTLRLKIGDGATAWADLPHATITPDEVTSLIGALDADAVGADVAGSAAAAVASAGLPGSVGLRTAALDAWYAALAGRISAPVDIVVVSDSIGAQDSAIGSSVSRAWPWHLSRRLNGVTPTTGATEGWRVAKAGEQFSPCFTTNQGTPTADVPGFLGTTMTNGQKATLVGVTMDGFSLVYSSDPSYGSLVVRDGVGGTVLGTIDCSGPAKSGKVWTSGAMTLGTHTIEVESVGATKWAGGYVHRGNRTSGVRVWLTGQQGRNTEQVNTAAVSLDLIEQMQPDLVILASGINDLDGSYDARMRSLVANVRDVYDGPVALWIPFQCATVQPTEELEALAIAAEFGLHVINASKFVGVPIERSPWAGVTVHPNVPGTFALADHVFASIGGDPLAAAAALSAENRDGQTWGSGANTVVIAGTSLTFGDDTAIARVGASDLAIGSGASFFSGRPNGLALLQAMQLNEIDGGHPAAPPANHALLYLIDNGSGKTQAFMRFATGDPVPLAIQP